MDKEATAKLASVLKQAIMSEELSSWFNKNSLDPYWTDGSAAMEDSLKVLANLQQVVAKHKIQKKKKK